MEDKTRVWVRADDVRVRADCITTIQICDVGLRLHIARQGTPVSLTLAPAAPADPSEHAACFERWADELLGCIEDADVQRRGGLITFQDADEGYEAGFAILALPGLRILVPRRKKPTDYAAIPPAEPDTVRPAASLGGPAGEIFQNATGETGRTRRQPPRISPSDGTRP